MSLEECYFTRSVYFILLTPSMSCALMVRSASCACLTSFHKYPVAFTPMPETSRWTFLLALWALQTSCVFCCHEVLPLPGLYFLFTPPSFRQANEWGSPIKSKLKHRLLKTRSDTFVICSQGIIIGLPFLICLLCDYFMFNFPSRLQLPWEQGLAGSGLARHCFLYI